MSAMKQIVVEVHADDEEEMRLQLESFVQDFYGDEKRARVIPAEPDKEEMGQ